MCSLHCVALCYCWLWTAYLYIPLRLKPVCVWEEETGQVTRVMLTEAVCEDPLYRRKMAFYSLPKTGHDPISSQDQLNMKFMTRIQILEYYPEKSAYRWEFCLHFQRTSLFLFTWWTFNLSSPVLFLPPFLFPSHPPRTQSNGQWSSLETNSRRKMQWSYSSWFCSTWETAKLRYLLWLALAQCFHSLARCYMYVVVMYCNT